jgi:hypothetical protein
MATDGARIGRIRDEPTGSESHWGMDDCVGGRVRGIGWCGRMGDGDGAEVLMGFMNCGRLPSVWMARGAPRIEEVSLTPMALS